MRVPLARPAPNEGEPVRWRSPAIAVLGEGASELATRLRDELAARGIDAALLVVETRVSEGATREGERLAAHPDALREALSDPGRLTIGVGDAFGRVVACELRVRLGKPTPRRERLAPARAELWARSASPALAAALARSWPDHLT
ncbi:MAG: hypothetical protein AB7S26_31260 [Sandaracinaceae bacterium]